MKMGLVVVAVAAMAAAATGGARPESGRLYLPSADCVAASGGRPQPQPGSFKVLVRAPAP